MIIRDFKPYLPLSAEKNLLKKIACRRLPVDVALVQGLPGITGDILARLAAQASVDLELQNRGEKVPASGRKHGFNAIMA